MIHCSDCHFHQDDHCTNPKSGGLFLCRTVRRKWCGEDAKWFQTSLKFLDPEPLTPKQKRAKRTIKAVRKLQKLLT